MRFSAKVKDFLVVKRLDNDLEAVGAIEKGIVNGIKGRVAQIDQSLGFGTFCILEVIEMLHRSVEHEIQVFPLFRLFIHFLVEEIEIASDDDLIVFL